MIPVPERTAPHGMVAAVNYLAAEAGVAMLRAGGSAVDGAIAANAVLAVIEQHMCGLGGDLFVIVATGDAPVVLNASGRAGSGASAQQLRDEGHAVMPFRDDIRSVPIPGCVDGWVTAHARFGRLPMTDVLAPAIDYARHGFPPSWTGAMTRAFMGQLPGGDDYAAPGDTMRRPLVADALEAIAADGRDAFYDGAFGEGLLSLGDGLYSKDDLAQSQAEWVDPISVDAFGHRIWAAPPNSQAYLALAAAWIAEGLDLPDDPDDPRWAHLLVEAARQAAFDRLDVLHDAADGAALVAPSRLAPRRDAIDPERAAVLGDAYGGGGTMCLSVVDADRMGVTLIQSNASGWGSNLVEPNTRIFLQNRGTGFSLVPGHPAEFAPGRRPPHTLSPLMVTRPDGLLRTSLATMGGDSQPQVLLQLLVRLLHHGESAGRAVAEGRFALASQDVPSTGFDTWNNRGRVKVRVESNAPAGWVDGLARRSHVVDPSPAFDSGFGHAHVIDVQNDVLVGGADPRSRSGGVAAY
ncbi:MAG TPA: gamma-glutamyltransferase [Acidimicrobiales bacterium]|nr:gamma-glutamyltransferase [Acidimicrobiales bacterium]